MCLNFFRLIENPKQLLIVASSVSQAQPWFVQISRRNNLSSAKILVQLSLFCSLSQVESRFSVTKTVTSTAGNDRNHTVPSEPAFESVHMRPNYGYRLPE